MTTSKSPRSRRAKPEVTEVFEPAVEEKAPEPVKAKEVSEPAKESSPAKLTPDATLEKKLAQIEEEGRADLSSGQRIGARLIALAEMRNKG